MTSLEFVVEDSQTNRVVDTARAVAGDALERITIAPIDGTPRSTVVLALRLELVAAVMDAVMKALDKPV